MARATRIYLALDKVGKPILARTVKREMKLKLQMLIEDGIDVSEFEYWTMPDGGSCGSKVDINFFLQS